MAAETPVKHVEVRSFARGSVYITDPSTSAGNSDGGEQSPSDNSTAAWQIITLGKSDGEAAKTCMYLPPESLMYAGNYVRVEPDAAVGRLDNFGYCELLVSGQLTCSLYKDANGDTKAELRIGPRQGAFFSFLVCEVNGVGGDGGVYVMQFAFGTMIIPSETAAGPFQAKLGQNGAVAGFNDGFVQVGGKTVEVTGTDTPPGENEFVAVRMPATANPSESASVQYYADLAALNEAQEDPAYVIVPLYKLGQVTTGEDSDEETITAIVMDMRQMPFAQMAEVLV